MDEIFSHMVYFETRLIEVEEIRKKVVYNEEEVDEKEKKKLPFVFIRRNLNAPFTSRTYEHIPTNEHLEDETKHLKEMGKRNISNYEMAAAILEITRVVRDEENAKDEEDYKKKVEQSNKHLAYAKKSNKNRVKMIAYLKSNGMDDCCLGPISMETIDMHLSKEELRKMYEFGEAQKFTMQELAYDVERTIYVLAIYLPPETPTSTADDVITSWSYAHKSSQQVISRQNGRIPNEDEILIIALTELLGDFAESKIVDKESLNSGED
ncbi:hypothetical protein E3N88_18339 [Mikania micrantha]|uniref:Uncharacterized protein n=1 Tax=Mikania micrantha TaxID=192012 RepID=A0A5N6NW87_9ASTR|nr:hypothetical protein E3N88_18339 [Mikania micrantha]